MATSTYLDMAPSLPLEKVEAELQTSFKTGLSADEVKRRVEKYGLNKLPEDPPKPLMQMIIEQFEDFLVRILLAAALISFALAFFEEDESEKLTAWIEPLVILLILIANACVGVWQERNADEAIRALMKLSASKAVVIRDGKEENVPAEELVPGDLILCSSGDQVPADCRVVKLRSTTIRVDQSHMTGESVSIVKHEEPVEQVEGEKMFYKNMLYSSTNVTYGKAECVVTHTGLATKFGNIFQQTKDTEEEKTPLAKKLDQFGAQLTRYIGVICLAVWVVNLPHFHLKGGWLKGCIFYAKQAVALAVAAIPEGLPAVVTTCLALGTRRMAKKKALVRKLASVETLGCTTVICSDKTGTLTTNKMVVRKVRTLNSNANVERYNVKGTNFNPVDDDHWGSENCTVDPAALVDKDGKGAISVPLEGDKALADLAAVAALCNEANLTYNKEEQRVERVNDAMEAALLVLVDKLGGVTRAQNTQLQLINKPEERLLASSKFFQDNYTKNGTLEFTRDRKSMSVHVSEKSTGKNFLMVKGAPDLLVERCTHYKADDGQIKPLDAKAKAAIFDEYHLLASGAEALRCLGFASKEAEPFSSIDLTDPSKFVKVESGLTFLGFVGILDPPRKEVKAGIKACEAAHIRVIVITGDNKDTAEAICREIGVFDPEESTKGKAFTGQEFELMSPKEQEEAILKAKLFARAVPEHKKIITDRLQAHGFVCAMTGDGVNDALALKKADIGIGMGSGTEVAKKSSDMILEDDNFSTIVHAVEEGRTIYNNTKQFIRYLISSNIGEVVCIFLTGLLGMPEVLVPIQLLWVNLVTDGLPATALGFNPPEPDIMKVPPRRADEPIVNGRLFFRYMVIGCYVGISTVLGFAIWVMFAPNGPQVSWEKLCDGQHEWLENPTGEWAEMGGKKIPMTVALSVLVTIEMFNALNALSENQSLFTVGPFANPLLLMAVFMSFSLHFLILYVPFLAMVFGVAPLDQWSWMVVLCISAPVVILDEVLKISARRSMAALTKAD